MMTRRQTLGSALALGATAMARPAFAAGMFPIVETAQGKLRGLESGGVSIFRGVSYAADTSGANRFMPPQPVEPWAGVRDALHWTDVAPQIPGDRRHVYADLIMVDRNPSGMGEDNLSLNLWSPGLDPNAKKPVIVVLHGGGFYSGSGNSVGMDGEAMARFTDSVVIAINHRLGAFGFLHLAEFGGEEFATSGTVGMQDIVAALGWVRENVAAFGGDPDRVLVYGQSGGGAKTSVLMAMPGGKGLFHRAGVMSGSALRMMPPEMASATAKRLMDALEIAPGDVRKLQEVPWTTLLETQAKLEAADRAKGEAPRSFAPVVDGIALPRHPWDPDAPAVSADVPMIVSSVLDERAYRMGDFAMDEARSPVSTWVTGPPKRLPPIARKTRTPRPSCSPRGSNPTLPSANRPSRRPSSRRSRAARRSGPTSGPSRARRRTAASARSTGSTSRPASTTHAARSTARARRPTRSPPPSHRAGRPSLPMATRTTSAFLNGSPTPRPSARR